MVAIVVTSHIRALLLSANATNCIERTSNVETISHNGLLSAIRATGSKKPLTYYLKSSELHLTHADAAHYHLPPPPRNPQLEARVSRLRSRQQAADYARMVRDVARVDVSNVEVEALRMSKLAPQMSLAFNVVVTMATCFVAGYFLLKNTSGSETAGLIGGVIGMIVAMGVEAVLLLTKMYTIDVAVEKHVKQQHRLATRHTTTT